MRLDGTESGVPYMSGWYCLAASRGSFGVKSPFLSRCMVYLTYAHDLLRQPLSQDCISHILSVDSVDSELSFQGEKPIGCSTGPEIRHLNHWHIGVGALLGEVLVIHDCVRRVTTFSTHPKSSGIEWLHVPAHVCRPVFPTARCFSYTRHDSC